MAWSGGEPPADHPLLQDGDVLFATEPLLKHLVVTYGHGGILELFSRCGMQSVTFVHVLAVVIVTQVNVLSWQCSWKLIVHVFS